MTLRLIITASLLALLAAPPAFAQEGLSDECINAGYSTAEECYGAAEPAYDEEPAYEEPAYDEPVYAEPGAEEPVYEEPAYDEPEEIVEEPAAEEPVYDEPEVVEDEPIYDEPAAEEEPVYEDEATPDEPAIVEEDATEETVVDDDAVSEEEPVIDEQDAVEDDEASEAEATDETAVPAVEDGVDEAVFDEEDGTGLIDDSAADEPYVEVIEQDDPLVGLPPEDLSAASEPLDGVAADEAMPLLDSAKEGDVAGADDGEDTVVPEDDEGAQVASLLSADEIVAAAPPESKVLAAAPAPVTPPNVTTIINNTENTYIYQVNNQTVINNYYDDRERIFDRDDDYWYDQIGPNRYRESVYRADGSTVVTTRDQYGNILERYVINANGSSYVLAYFEPDYYDDLDFWGDAGYGLPALRLTISLRDYVLDWRYADASAISVFLRYPPVEPARRVYSIDEVKRSARLRDSIRRLEVSDLNFASGASELSRNQARSLERLASAIKTLLRDNPGETFLIEGHTDAVGSDQSNLLLSDKRASAVARILTRYYDIPPENLATQGYGARYLRVNTQRAEPQNRRVTVRRITPLVQPYFAGR